MATSTGGTLYSDQQVYAMLMRSGLESFTFDWLDQNRVYRGDLTPYLVDQGVPELRFDATQAVQRTMSFTTLGMPAALNPFADLIRPHFRLLAPDGGWLDWPLATLPLNPPRKKITEGYSLLSWSAGDFGDLLLQDEFDTTFALRRGTNAISGIREIVGSLGAIELPILIPDYGKVLTVDYSWDAGANKLQAVLDVLTGIAFTPCWFDELGQMRSRELPDYGQEVAVWTWDATAGQSIVLSDGLAEDPDMTNVVNFCRVNGEHVQNHRPFSGYYENTRPDSPVSTQRLGRKKVKVINDSKMTSDDACFLRARSEVQAGARVFSKFSVETLPWPVGQNHDVYHMPYLARDESLQDWNYLLFSSTLRLAPGRSSTHVMQRVLPT